MVGNCYLNAGQIDKGWEIAQAGIAVQQADLEVTVPVSGTSRLGRDSQFDEGSLDERDDERHNPSAWGDL